MVFSGNLNIESWMLFSIRILPSVFLQLEVKCIIGSFIFTFFFVKISRLLYCPNCGTNWRWFLLTNILSWEKLWHIVNCYTFQYTSQSVVYFSINYTKIWYNNSLCGNIYDRYGEKYSILNGMLSFWRLLHYYTKTPSTIVSSSLTTLHSWASFAETTKLLDDTRFYLKLTNGDIL